jgi:hypothetical protein
LRPQFLVQNLSPWSMESKRWGDWDTKSVWWEYLWPAHRTFMGTINPKWPTLLDLNRPYRKSAIQSVTMRSENRSQWVNHWLLTLRQMTTCPTSWLRRIVAQNATSLLAGLSMIFMTTFRSNRTWPGKTSQLTSVTRLVLMGLRKYARAERVSQLR